MIQTTYRESLYVFKSIVFQSIVKLGVNSLMRGKNAPMITDPSWCSTNSVSVRLKGVAMIQMSVGICKNQKIKSQENSIFRDVSAKIYVVGWYNLWCVTYIFSANMYFHVYACV